jgi:hypothetical protein
MVAPHRVADSIAASPHRFRFYNRKLASMLQNVSFFGLADNNE